MDCSQNAGERFATSYSRQRIYGIIVAELRLNAAEAAIQGTLARDPLGQGTDVGEGLRKLTVAPLTVYYEVRAAQGFVEVQAVAYTP